MDATTSIAEGNAPFNGNYIPEGNNNGINFDNLIENLLMVYGHY